MILFAFVRTVFLIIKVLGLSLCSLLGEVVINEIITTHAPRNLRWNSNNQPFAGSGDAWWLKDFDDSVWETGSLPIGYSLGTIETNVRDDLLDVSPSLYVRQKFEIDDDLLGGFESLDLSIQYDDGFILWLNGVELSRRNMGASKGHIYHDQIAHRGSDMGVSGESITLLSAAALLVEGENTIAIQLNNRSLAGDMRLDFSLTMDRPDGPDPVLIPLGSQISYLAGLSEPTGDLVETASPTNDPSDCIELFNNGAEVVDLSGWSLSDDDSVEDKWSFPAGTQIAPGEFLIVLADAPEMEIPGAQYLHANFQLSGVGEFLGLFDDEGNYISGFATEYPPQLPNYSFGRGRAGNPVFFEKPTPGQANDDVELTGLLDAPQASLPGGFYDEAIRISFETEIPETTLRYTTDGSEPTLVNGTDLSGELELGVVSATAGHVIRVRAFRDGWIPSRTTTHTYLVGVDERLRNSPMLALAGDERRSLYDPYGALALNGGQYDSSRRWLPTGPFDFNNIIERGRAYERPAHAEFFFCEGVPGFRADLGLRIAASPAERPRMRMARPFLSPWETHPNEKPSFNLYVRNDYGKEAVKFPFQGEKRSFHKYERFRIRAGKEDISNPFIIDELVRRLSHEMGIGASLGVINSLIVNGEFKGYYNLVERLRSPFFSRLHGADDETDWDVLAPDFGTNIAEGDKVAWNNLLNRLSQPLSTENWKRILDVADPENMANYFLLNIYAGTWEWPGHNWVIAKERSEAGRFRLYIWDAEGAFGFYGPHSPSKEMIGPSIIGTDPNSTGQSGMRGELRDLWNGLNRWPEFRLLFADQVQEHLFNGGVLDDRDPMNSRVQAMWDELRQEFQGLAELSGITQIQTASFDSWLHPTWGRRNYLLGPRAEEFRRYNLWPELAVPKMSKFGGVVASGFSLELTWDEGEIYYTTDGSDPRLIGGGSNPQAIRASGGSIELVVSDPLTVRVRGFSGGQWSALSTATFLLESVPAGPANLAITELLYNPIGASAAEVEAGFDDGDFFEYVRLRNVSDSVVDLSEVRFVDGISFDFKDSAIQVLPPGGKVIIVRNIEAFRLRFGEQFHEIVAGEYLAKFSNGGERVLLVGADDEVIEEFEYGTEGEWPDLAEEDGHSIQKISVFLNPAEGETWEASKMVGGSLKGPMVFEEWQRSYFEGSDLFDQTISGKEADEDSDGWSNLLEFAFGSSPLDGEDFPEIPKVEMDVSRGSLSLSFEFKKPKGDRAVAVFVQESNDLMLWEKITAENQKTVSDGPLMKSCEIRIVKPLSGRNFYRLSVSER